MYDLVFNDQNKQNITFIVFFLVFPLHLYTFLQFQPNFQRNTQKQRKVHAYLQRNRTFCINVLVERGKNVGKSLILFVSFVQPYVLHYDSHNFDRKDDKFRLSMSKDGENLTIDDQEKIKYQLQLHNYCQSRLKKFASPFSFFDVEIRYCVFQI